MSYEYLFEDGADAPECADHQGLAEDTCRICEGGICRRCCATHEARCGEESEQP